MNQLKQVTHFVEEENMQNNLSIKKVNILGVWVDNITRAEIVGKIVSIIESRSDLPKLIGSVQTHKLNVAYKDKQVAHYLNSCDLCYCDGNGVRWGSILLGKPLKERMTAPDFIVDLFKECSKRRYSVYVIGGRPGVLEKAFSRILPQVPDLNLIGKHHGYFDSIHENQKIINEINVLKPDLLIVGMGIPKQEKWVLANKNSLNAKAIWALGATFDYFAGAQSRGPAFFRKIGHEWLGRLFSNPGRFAKRYLIGNPLFYFRILKEKLF